MKKKKVIGVVGHPASGKDTVAEYLAGKGFTHFSSGNVIREKMKEAGLPLDRSSMQEFSRGERVKHGNHYPSAEIVEQVEGNTVISGFRNTAEIDFFKNHFGEEFVLIAVDAPLEHRYKLAKARGRIGDDISLEHFKKEDEREKAASGGSHEVDQVILMADKVINNHGSLDELFRQIDELL
jgi:dephospho-CoA kinase